MINIIKIDEFMALMEELKDEFSVIGSLFIPQYSESTEFILRIRRIDGRTMTDFPLKDGKLKQSKQELKDEIRFHFWNQIRPMEANDEH